jgi:AraC-like DNA-binding protein
MRYVEHPAPAALSPWLMCLWERREDGAPVRVVPDGCIDVVWTAGRGTQLVGANTTAFVAGLPAGGRAAGARLRPGAAPALLGVRAEAVRDARIDVGELWGADGARLADGLERSRAPVAGLERWLAARAAGAPPPDPVVAAAVAVLERDAEAVRALAAAVALSERSLRRRVTVAVGYGPKLLARVLRLRRALDSARQGTGLARVAAEAGYSDQAHFSGDCRELAGVAPTALL